MDPGEPSSNEPECPRSYSYMGRSYADAGDSSGAFSDCNSDRSSEFSASTSDGDGATAAMLQRLLLSCAADSDDDVIGGLVAQLESPSASVDSLRRAAMELRLLAKHNPDNRLRIVEAGAVRPLVVLLSHSDPLLQEHCATTLLNLSLCEENRGPIAEAGAVRSLVRVLKTGTPAARENAACALVRLSQLEGQAAAIGRAGAIPLLVALLETGRPRGKKDAATALYSLCKASKENKIQAVKTGVVRPLLELMADLDSGMAEKAAHVLRTVVTVAEGRGAAVEEGGIPVLVEMLEMGSQPTKEAATLTLHQICEDSTVYRTMAAGEGALPPLVALSQAASTKPKLKTKVEALIELLRQPRAGRGLPRVAAE